MDSPEIGEKRMSALMSATPSPSVLRLLMDLHRLLPVDPRAIDRPDIHEIILATEQNARSFDECWSACCALALADRASEAHGLRDGFLAAFADTKDIMREVVQLARRVGREDAELQRLEAGAIALEQKLERLASRWQTAEDLEDLAAESIALPPEHLEAVRRKYGFPQAWYDEDSKPF